MSATIYKVRLWCDLKPEEITKVVNDVVTGFVYKAEDFYNEVEKLGAWKPATEENDSVCIWSGYDAGPVIINSEEVGFFAHFDDDANQFDWACIYELE